MPKHCFVAVCKEDIGVALNYYENRNIEGNKCQYKICLVDDRLILPNIRLFANVNVFSQNLENEVNNLDYYGRTIMPTTAVREIMRRIAASNLDLNKRWSDFVELLRYSLDNNYYVVHLGI